MSILSISHHLLYSAMITISLSLLSVSVGAQKNIIIESQPSVDKLMNRFISNGKATETIKAWRIQIITTDDRREMEAAMSTFSVMYPDINMDWQHVVPYYQVRHLIAVIDDDDDLCSSIGDFMRANEYRVELFLSAEPFLACLNRFHFDCVIADIHMPGTSGLTCPRAPCKWEHDSGYFNYGTLRKSSGRCRDVDRSAMPSSKAAGDSDSLKSASHELTP